jgi:HSP20 family protein
VCAQTTERCRLEAGTAYVEVTMLLRFDPFREFDRLAEEMWKGQAQSPMRIPMDAFRRGDSVEIHFELPGVDPSSIDLEVERNTLTVSAERTVSNERREGEEVMVRERRHGRFTRQLTLGDNLDVERLEARYDDGVLTVVVPVVEQAKARKVEITRGSATASIEATSHEGGGDHTTAA